MTERTWFILSLVFPITFAVMPFGYAQSNGLEWLDAAIIFSFGVVFESHHRKTIEQYRIWKGKK